LYKLAAVGRSCEVRDMSNHSCEVMLACGGRAVQYLYKMLLCSACLPLAAAVLLGSLPLLFFAPWGILYMALVTWPNKASREADFAYQDWQEARVRRKPRISRREATRSRWTGRNTRIYTDGSVPGDSSKDVTDFLVNIVRPLTCSLYAVLWFACILGRLAWIAIWPGSLDAAEQLGVGEVRDEVDPPDAAEQLGAGDVRGEAVLLHSKCEAEDASSMKKRNKRGGMKQHQLPRQNRQIYNKKTKRKSSKHPCDHFVSLQDMWTDALLAIRWEMLRPELENHMRSHEQVIRSWKTSVFRRPQQKHTQRVCAERYDVSALLSHKSSDAIVDASTWQLMRAFLERRGIHYTMTRRDDVQKKEHSGQNGTLEYTRTAVCQVIIRAFPLKGGAPKKEYFLRSSAGRQQEESSQQPSSSVSTSSTNAAGSSSSQHEDMSPALRKFAEGKEKKTSRAECLC
jgi:hypothetical protein